MTSSREGSYAAVDLGSNSFHMIVANFVEGRLQIIDRIKDMVRLASGLNDNQELSEESMQHALECLQRFGQRIREISHVNVRAVGTNTLRQARNSRIFLSKAHTALGHPIEILAGREEARLIYLGVAHTLYDETNKRLVIDIGGGSTELIIGRGFDTYYTESLYMGCVNLGPHFFSNDRITAKRMRKAVLFARQELEPIEAPYKKMGWDLAVGSSGTVISIRDVVQAQGWCETGITASALAKLKDELIAIGDSKAVCLEGLSERRKPVFASGVAVLSGIFEAFDLDQISVSEGALREGLLHDLIGRVHNEDTRDKTVMDVAQRYGVDTEQAKRVKETAELFFWQVKADWLLDEKSDLKLLQWGSLIHEIGLSIAHTQYHRHGAYLMTHSDLAGFSRQEQTNLATLVRAHRRKFPREELDLVASSMKISILRLCILLRLAVVIHRSRSYSTLPKIQVRADKDKIDLVFPQGWLDNYPLTRVDLNTEQSYLQVADIKLTFQ
ncbi:MAG: exopolyphosphatase [Nitrosomonas sp.]|nr:exopolyphosphatase [Nitrosomonas sp.]MDP1950755.1 exopolyphosphatase [Nitrosomonas sp.]